MELLDIHTHKADSNNLSSIYNSNIYIEERNISIGIHPWNISNDWKEFFTAIKEHARKENVRAIGECGIDKLKSPAGLEQQIEIFKAHAILAEEVNKPLIIHCVKGFDELIALHKEMNPVQAWIIHGFRGKPQQTEQLTKAGFYLSFGEKFNTESLKSTPVEKLFVESDESNLPIHEIYRNIAENKGISTEELAMQTAQNAQKCGIFI